MIKTPIWSLFLRMTTNFMKDNATNIDRDEFCHFLTDLIKSSLPLSLFHFALEVDNTLSLLLPNRDDHIAAVVQQAFKVSIKSSQLRHYLHIFKQAADHELLSIWHTKNVDNELTEYTKKEMRNATDASYQYCQFIQIEPPDKNCPK